MTDAQARFDFEAPAPVDPLEARDAEARRRAVDPRRNVALEASAGTGKTRVLVDRYVALITAGVKPRNILAITFTRKAAAEMRQRILQELARRQRSGHLPAKMWTDLRDSLSDISISTIDAFCLSLLHEFPLEADVDPGFELADETETPRLIEEALERTLRIGRSIAVEQPEMALLFAHLSEYRLRDGLTGLIDRRLVAVDALGRFLRRAQTSTIEQAVVALLDRLRKALGSVPGGIERLLTTGPARADFLLVAADLRELLGGPAPSAPLTQALLERVREYLLTSDGKPRKRLSGYKKSDFRSSSDYERHLAMVTAVGPSLAEALHEYRRDLNLVLARTVQRLFLIAIEQYRRTLHAHGVLDFPEVLERTLALLRQMDEFSRSRFMLESRFQHVLVDEFQDTSRAQWELVELLVRSWAAGSGLSERDLAPSIFIVGDRKQSIYGFRDAEVAVLDEASRYIDALRPGEPVRTAITRSFRAVRELLHFVNDVFAALDKRPERADAFRYGEADVFPLTSVNASDRDALAVVAALSDEEQAEAVGGEIARLLATAAPVRDRDTGAPRAIRPGDIAILFRTREGHRVFEEALARRRVPYYVYKGLGFFDADEIKDVLALLTFLARPESALHAAAFLRSRFVALSDEALKLLAPHLADSITAPDLPPGFAELHDDDARRFSLARGAVPKWLDLVDRLPPAELLDRVLSDSAYAAETAGPAHRQARENLKKVRGLVRRIQNRGYVTLGRVVAILTQLVAGGDESNAIIDALDAVHLMTVHAAKGLEFPVVFVVHLHRGSGGAPDAMRVLPAPLGQEETVSPSVAIGGHESEADRDMEAREAEESKRLLYVALTRARDRIYLSATLAQDGRFVAGKGGLGRTLPATLTALLPAAQGAIEQMVWEGATGRHRLRVVGIDICAPTFDPPGESPSARVDDFAPLVFAGIERIAATALARGRDGAASPRDDRSLPSSLTAGRLAHRALQARDDVPIDRLVRSDERLAIGDVDELVRRVAAAVSRIRSHPMVAEALSMSGAVRLREHEAPFSLIRDGVVVRGAIDLLVQRSDGDVQVFEFKTGGPSDAHGAQLDLYIEAAQAMFPGESVRGHLVYAGGEPFVSDGRLTE